MLHGLNSILTILPLYFSCMGIFSCDYSIQKAKLSNTTEYIQIYCCLELIRGFLCSILCCQDALKFLKITPEISKMSEPYIHPPNIYIYHCFTSIKEASNININSEES